MAVDQYFAVNGTPTRKRHSRHTLPSARSRPPLTRLKLRKPLRLHQPLVPIPPGILPWLCSGHGSDSIKVDTPMSIGWTLSQESLRAEGRSRVMVRLYARGMGRGESLALTVTGVSSARLGLTCFGTTR